MGYACPVCEHPQADAEHLANHLAITAIARGGAHERWLDEHVDEWETQSAAELAAALAPHVEETATPIDDVRPPAGQRPPSGQAAHEDAADGGHQPPSTTPDGAVGAETRAALSRARELTRRRAAKSETDSSDGA